MLQSVVSTKTFCKLLHTIIPHSITPEATERGNNDSEVSQHDNWPPGGDTYFSLLRDALVRKQSANEAAPFEEIWLEPRLRRRSGIHRYSNNFVETRQQTTV